MVPMTTGCMVQLKNTELSEEYLNYIKCHRQLWFKYLTINKSNTYSFTFYKKGRAKLLIKFVYNRKFFLYI